MIHLLSQLLVSTELVSLSICLNPSTVSVKLRPLVPLVSTSLLDLTESVESLEIYQSKLPGRFGRYGLVGVKT